MNYKFFARYIDQTKSYNGYKDFLFFEENKWDDYGFRTLFEVYIPKDNGKLIKIGAISIANINATTKNGNYIAFDEFDTDNVYKKLPEDFISLGNKDFYYNLHKFFNQNQCQEILNDLNDLCSSYDKDEKNIYFSKDVVNDSFFRGYTLEEAIERIEFTLKPLADAGNREGYNITYKYLFDGKLLSEINFVSDPEYIFPQNVHAIIGANASGKTTFLKDILLLAINQELQEESLFRKDNQNLQICFSSRQDIKIDSPRDYFSKVILISFSPFDNLFLESGNPLGENGNVKYLGIYQNGTTPVNLKDLYFNFLQLINQLRNHRDNWLFFKDILRYQGFHGDILPIVEAMDTAENDNDLWVSFDKLSAGQKIILLSITTLIVEVEQFSLVLIDEPELFLHPPMISNYIRSISEIMRKKNGLCILTTHSPIIVQEIPKDCVKLIQSNEDGGIKMIEPAYETLGENLSTLTNTIFELNQYQSGFYLLIKDIINNPEKYDLLDEDIKDLTFGRDGMLYKELLLSDLYESEED